MSIGAAHCRDGVGICLRDIGVAGDVDMLQQRGRKAWRSAVKGGKVAIPEGNPAGIAAQLTGNGLTDSTCAAGENGITPDRLRPLQLVRRWSRAGDA